MVESFTAIDFTETQVDALFEAVQSCDIAKTILTTPGRVCDRSHMLRREFCLSLVGLAATFADAKETSVSWLSSTSHNLVKQNLTNIEGIYQAVKPGMICAMGSQFSTQPDRHLRFAFASFLAWDLKPYGQSAELALLDLINAPDLDCDNYVRLAWFFYQLMVPDTASEVLVLGWEGGPVGNHAQIQISTPGYPSMLCDPTIGLAVHGIGFDDLCARFNTPANWLYSIFGNNSRPDMNKFNEIVQGAIMTGGYRASHLLYVYNRIDTLNGVDRSRLGTYPVRNEQIRGG